MPAGRPRTASLQPDEMISLGEEMLEWVEENEPIHLCEFYTFYKNITDKDWNAMRHAPEFLHYYNSALKKIGMQYLKKDSPIEPSLKQRWARVYFKDLKEQEDADLDAAADRSKKIAAVQQSTQVNLNVPSNLAIGSNISTATVSDTDNKGPQ